MRRRRESDSQDIFERERTSSTSRRWYRSRRLILGILLTLFAFIFGVPMLVRSPAVLLGLVKWSGAIAPLSLEVDSIEAGWFRPIALNGVKVLDENAKPLAVIERVSTELSLLRVIRNRSDLGRISLQSAEVFVDVQPGTTNIEKSLAPFMEPSEEPSSASVQGSLWVENSIIHMVDSITQQTWDMQVEQFSLKFPESSAGQGEQTAQLIPPIEARGRLLQVNPPSAAPGIFQVRMQTAMEGASAGKAIDVVATLEALPLSIWGIVKRRVGDLPIDEIGGSISLEATGRMESATNWSFEVTKGRVEKLVVVAPTLVGEQPARVEYGLLAGKWVLDGKRLMCDANQLECDFGQVRLVGNVPWPIVVPSVTTPWIPDASFDFQGNIDMPKLLAVAPTLVSMRENLRLVKGQADVRLNQTLDPRGLPQSAYSLKLGDLEARVQGQDISWKDPLSANMQVAPDAAGNVRFQGDVKAEFCELQGNGTVQRGRVTGNVDLARLQQRLQEFVDLPIEKITGSADTTVAWEQQASGSWHAQGDLQTTSLSFIAPGGELFEPAWRGEVDLDGRIEGGTLTRIDRAKVVLKSKDEEAIVELFEPISVADLINPATEIRSLPPATAHLKLVGDLASWQRRAMLFQPDLIPGEVAGRIDLKATALVDTKHIELTKATWTSQPLQYSTPQISIAEPQMVGEFTGRVDSQDLTRLEISNLEVQATSFALRASDNAKGSSDGTRQGQGVFRINLASLMNSITTPTANSNAPGSSLPGSSLPGSANRNSTLGNANTGSATGDVLLSGDITGSASWAISSKGIAWNIQADGTNLKAENGNSVGAPRGALVSTSGASNRQLLWEEKQLKANCQGNWEMATGKISMPTTQLQTEWIAYGGKVDITPTSDGQKLALQGQYTYDADQVARRVAPWTGGYVQMVGQRTEPVELTLITKNDSKEPMLKQLQASAKIGWDSAKAIGIDIGAADIPVTIRDGVFQSASEVPVSKGRVRFDLTGDLNAPVLMIQQKPDTVIEQVAITPEMYRGWLKYITPIIAEATSAEGEMSLRLDRAELYPTDPARQTVAGQVTIHRAVVGPGPLASQLVALVRQVDSIRKGELLNPLAPPLSSQGILPGATDPQGGASASLAANSAENRANWLQMPEQKIDFLVENGRVIHRNVSIEVGDVTLATMGSVGVDGTLEMNAQIPIKDEWIQKQPFLAPLAGKSLDVPIRGTISQPVLDTQSMMSALTSLGTGAAVQAGQNAFQREFNKQLQKLPLDKLEKPLETLDRFFSPIRPPQ